MSRHVDFSLLPTNLKSVWAFVASSSHFSSTLNTCRNRSRLEGADRGKAPESRRAHQQSRAIDACCNARWCFRYLCLSATPEWASIAQGHQGGAGGGQIDGEFSTRSGPPNSRTAGAHPPNSSTLDPPSVMPTVASMAGPGQPHHRRGGERALRIDPHAGPPPEFLLIRQIRRIPSGARGANALKSLLVDARRAGTQRARARLARTSGCRSRAAAPGSDRRGPARSGYRLCRPRNGRCERRHGGLRQRRRRPQPRTRIRAPTAPPPACRSTPGFPFVVDGVCFDDPDKAVDMSGCGRTIGPAWVDHRRLAVSRASRRASRPDPPHNSDGQQHEARGAGLRRMQPPSRRRPPHRARRSARQGPAPRIAAWNSRHSARKAVTS